MPDIFMAQRERDLHSILRSGDVSRWHSNPDLSHIRESVAEHHCRVAQIIRAFHPACSRNLLDAALHHDCGEMIVGDLPSPFKTSSPAAVDLHAAAEARALEGMGITIDLSPEDARWLKFADRAAAWWHVHHRAPHILQRADWQEAQAWLIREASALGVSVSRLSPTLAEAPGASHTTPGAEAVA